MLPFSSFSCLRNLRSCIPQLKQGLKLISKYLVVILVLYFFSSYVSLFHKVVFFQVVKYLCLHFLVTSILYIGKVELSSRGLYIIISFFITMTLWDSLSWRYYSSQELFSKERPHFFIAGNLYNNEEVFYDYTQGLEAFANQVGRENVFISIVEDHSTDRTPELLKDWSNKLQLMGVAHKINIGFKMPNHDKVERIEKLAYLRNVALQPFFDKETGLVDSNTINWNYTQTSPLTIPRLNTDISQDSRVIFINDIYYFKEDLISLINTNNGDYDAACATDFNEAMLYDTWVIRDKNGKVPNGHYPFFNDKEDIEAWDSNLPVKVYSCWNGLVVFNSQLILHYFSPQLIPHIPFPHTLPDFLPHSSPPTPDLPGARFRIQNSPDECYASECSYIWSDLRSLSSYPINLYMNPNVKVGYQLYYYFKFKELLNWSFIKYLYKRYSPIRRHETDVRFDESEYACWKY